MLKTEFFNEENYSFWKNMFLGVTFFTIAPITLFISIFSLISLSKISPDVDNDFKPNSTSLISGARVYASLPDNTPLVSVNVLTSDARVEIVRQYLNKYKSPLESKAEFLVSTADKYGLDFRLLTAIAQQESNLCKIIPPESYNCWGWGIHSRGSLGFTSYEEAIETVSIGLKNEYIDKGYTTVEQIMKKYTPMSDGSWARGVNQFMNDME